ncbi:hypothetical protein AZI86_14320 [Bdellovibrio bacteriovorus]|uniref:HTH cro/C1-type domain-containing protein n=1 Tax=Bdellovibrio bacteriovorus TaxID=959 RepID=A0A150WKB7_BDEBC|nr:helix-turn-helix transcriptional regulator [Bdellovibrio bacteriovorus]KYG63981.1 hypothetical protein AZI86_14320 [Bdellovibrio bacteriovorus]
MATVKDDFILATRLKKLCIEKGISIKELSLETEVPLKTIYGWIAGSHPRNLRDVKKVAEALGVTIESLCFASPSKTKSPTAKKDSFRDEE